MKQVKGQVDMPDKFRINVEAVSSLPRSFVEVDIVAVRDQAYMTDIIHRDKWLLIELSALPFNFADLGRTLSGIVQSLQAPRIDGSDTVNGVPSWRIVGTVSSESLDTLVTAAEEGYRVALEVWIGQPQGLLRKVRIKGQILSTDLPDLVRVLTIHGFDQPVEITIPSISD